MKKYRRRWFIVFVIFFSITVCAWYSFWYVIPRMQQDPLLILNKRTPVRIWRDRHGNEMALERTCNGEWRFEIDIEKLPRCVMDVMLAIEDRNFFSHHGVDWPAVVRAAGQNFFGSRIISGASTITMQLAGLSIKPSKRTIWRKLRQVIAARSIELRHSKMEILRTYFNFIPFGGKLYGIEAASRYYLCRHASELSIAEAAALCGIPQRPEYWRPDRHLERTLLRRNRVLAVLVKQKIISEDSAQYFKSGYPLKWRDFKYNPWVTQQAPEIWSLAVKKINPERQYDVSTSIDCSCSSQVLAILRRNVKLLPKVQDSAAVVLDSKTGAVLVYVGTLDYNEPFTGQVDAASAKRSAGSTLKPFIYAESIEAGFIATDTGLLDAPLRFGDNYAPENYDRHYYGLVTAERALADSLNTPAIRLAEKLGVARLSDTLTRCRLKSGNTKSFSGLSEVFGVSGYTLFDLTTAYGMLAREGMFLPSSFHLKPRNQSGERVFQRGTSQLISRWLRSHHLSGGISMAWKTGTSNNHGDAWCIAYTPDYTVGVWCGNKYGGHADCLVGGTAAAPAADEIMLALYRNKPVCVWNDDELELRDVCAKSGLHPCRHCLACKKTVAVKNIPLEECKICLNGLDCNIDQSGEVEKINIISPKSAEYFTTTSAVVLPLKANRKSVFWFINGKSVPAGKFSFQSGERYLIRAVHIMDDGRPESAEITISVSGNSGQ